MRVHETAGREADMTLQRMRNLFDVDFLTIDAVVAVKVVTDVDEAIGHVNACGSNHTDAIVSADETAAERFLSRVDSVTQNRDTDDLRNRSPMTGSRMRN